MLRGKRVRRGEIRWSIPEAFTIALDWHGVLDRLISPLGAVLEPRPLELIQSLDSRRLPLEWVIVPFSGNQRADDLERQLQLFIIDVRDRGLAIAGYQITYDRVGPQGKSECNRFRGSTH